MHMTSTMKFYICEWISFQQEQVRFEKIMKQTEEGELLVEK
jgi:hypothetical protein